MKVQLGESGASCSPGTVWVESGRGMEHGQKLCFQNVGAAVSAWHLGLQFPPCLLLAGEPGCKSAAASGWLSPG